MQTSLPIPPGPLPTAGAKDKEMGKVTKPTPPGPLPTARDKRTKEMDKLVKAITNPANLLEKEAGHWAKQGDVQEALDLLKRGKLSPTEIEERDPRERTGGKWSHWAWY